MIAPQLPDLPSSFTVHPVTSIEGRELAPYRTLRRQLDHRRDGIFVAEGGFVVQRLLRSPLDVVSLLVTPVWLAKLRPQLTARHEATVIHVAQEVVLAEIVGFHAHQGVMAVGRIPPSPGLDEVLTASGRPLLVALDGVANPENLGVIMRTCAAFGVTAAVVGETAADPWLRRAVRNSMGAVFSVPTIPVADLAASLVHLQHRHGISCLAACPTSGVSPWDADLTRACCLVLGHEGDGVRPEVAKACAGAVTVPMALGLDSLNVAGAAAVVLYEVRRQRRKGTA